MDKDEMRACRREWINYYIQDWYFNSYYDDTYKLFFIKMAVRRVELKNYGYELKAYANG